MAHSPELGGNGGAGPAERPYEPTIGAPEKARFPSDPIYKSTDGEGPFPSGEKILETARTATDALRRQASQFAEDVGKTGESQKMRGVDALHRVARAIGGAADDIEGQSPTVAGAVREVARQVDSLSDTLAHHNVNELIDEATRFARERPVLLVAGSLAAGFVLSRFLTSGGRGPARAEPMPPEPFED